VVGREAAHDDETATNRPFPDLAEVAQASVEADIPLDPVPDLLDLVGLVDTADAVSLCLIPPTYIDGRTTDGYNIPNVDLIRDTSRLLQEGPGRGEGVDRHRPAGRCMWRLSTCTAIRGVLRLFHQYEFVGGNSLAYRDAVPR